MVEHQVAQAVDDEVAPVELGALEDVGMVADHHVGAGVDRGMCFGDLVGDRRVGVLDPPVKADDDVVDPALEPADGLLTRLMSVRAVATPGPLPAWSPGQ